MKHYTISIFLLTFSIVFFSSCTEVKKEEEKFIRPIKYQQINYLEDKKIKTFSGTAQTDKIINLSFRNSGIITRYNIKLGQKVKKGQLLAQLNNVSAKLSYEQAINQLNSAKSQMNMTKSSLGRIRSLYEKGSSSLNDFEVAKNAFQTAKENYESAKRGVGIQKEQTQYGYLYAPETGVIANVNSEKNENVSPGQIVATLNAGKDMEIILGVPENAINNIKEDMIAKVHFSSITQKEFNGKVTEVAPALDVNNSTYTIRIAVLDSSPEIRSGMAASVQFDFGTSDAPTLDKLIVPANSVGEDSKGHYVFLIIENGMEVRVKKQQVVIGLLTSKGFEIKSGLSVGQKIATAGLQTLLDGQLVKL
mgnify:CR=1 FL=1